MLTRAKLFVLLVGFRVAISSEPPSTTNGADEGHKITSDLIELDREGNKFRIWKVEEGKIVETNESNYSEFESSRSYIVQEVNSKVDSADWRTFYWIGKLASERDASDAAYNAVWQDHFAHSIINVYKEAEGYESSLFKELFKNTLMNKEEAEPSPSSESTKDEVDKNIKRMFVVEEPKKNQLRFREVNPISDYVDEEDCVVLISETIYVHCGTGASDKQRSGAKALAKIVSKQIGLDKEPTVIHRKSFHATTPGERIQMYQFWSDLNGISKTDRTRQIVERVDEFTLAEVRRILAQTVVEEDGTEWFDISLYKIYEGYPLVLKSNQKHQVCDRRMPILRNQHVPLDVLNAKNCYIADSCSNLGLFVWMGNSSKQSVRSESARKAEQLLKRKAIYNYATPVTYIDQRVVPKNVQTFQSLVRFLAPLKYVKRLPLK